MCDCSTALAAMQAEVSSLRYTQETLLETLRGIQGDVSPMLEKLQQSPIFKMLGV